MTLSIELPDALEKRLLQEAAEHGLDVAAYAQQLIEHSLSGTLNLLISTGLIYRMRTDRDIFSGRKPSRVSSNGCDKRSE